MEYTVEALTRRNINLICDAVLPIPSPDNTASHVYTKVMRERIRNQLVDIELMNHPDAIQMLIAYMVKRQRQAFVKDGTNVGLPASEGASASIAQVSMSAFKATSHDVSLATIVDKLSSSLSTVVDRNDQKVIVHFDPEWAPDGRNYSLREVADMRAIFVRTTLLNLINSDKTVIGVLEDFKGDGLTPSMIETKNNFREDSFCAYLEPGRWNRIRALKKGGTGIVCMRLYIESQLAYSRGVTMPAIIDSITNIAGELDCSVTGSSLQDGVVDILARDMGPNLLSTVSMLEKMKSSFASIKMSGMSDVSSLALERVDLIEEGKIFTSSKRAVHYRIAELGMAHWIQNTYKGDADLSWRDLEEESYLVPPDDVQFLEHDVPIIGHFDDGTACIYYPDFGGEHAQSEELTGLYINYYLGLIGAETLDTLWVLSLDVINIKVKCVSLELIEQLLNYSGLTVLQRERSRTSELIEYLYVSSYEDPLSVMKRHLDPQSYSNYSTNDSLSQTAIDAVDEFLAAAPEGQRQSLLQNIDSEFLDRLSKYYYAVLSIDAKKKSVNKDASPLVSHVASTVYAKVLEYPFVSREKTTSNDWFTMNYVLGADGAQNNHIREPLELFQGCDIKMDPRHLSLIANYIYERGSPSGVGLPSMQRHGIGFTHEMVTQNTYVQLHSGHLRSAEPVESYTISTYMGTPPVGPGTKEREVERSIEMEKMERSRIVLGRRGRARVAAASPTNVDTGTAKSTDSIDIAIRSMFLDTDPYYSVPQFKLEDVRAPERPGPLVPSGKYSTRIAERVRDRRALDGIVGRLELLREYTGHIRETVVMSEDEVRRLHLFDMDVLYNFFTANLGFFD